MKASKNSSAARQVARSKAISRVISRVVSREQAALLTKNSTKEAPPTVTRSPKSETTQHRRESRLKLAVPTVTPVDKIMNQIVAQQLAIYHLDANSDHHG